MPLRQRAHTRNEESYCTEAFAGAGERDKERRIRHLRSDYPNHVCSHAVVMRCSQKAEHDSQADTSSGRPIASGRSNELARQSSE